MQRILSILGIVTLLVVAAGQAFAVQPMLPWSEDQPAMPPHTPAITSPDQGARAGGGGALAGADYVVMMQADLTEDNAGNGNPDVDPEDAGWDWVTTVFYHSAAASPKNIYGTAGLGLYYAYLVSPKPSYFTAMKDAADVSVADAGIRSAASLKYLMLFDDLPEVAGTTYQDAARAKYDARILVYGSAAGLAAYIRDARHGQGYDDGIIAWDIAPWVVVAAMLDARYPGNGYDADSDAMAEVLYQDSFNDTPGYFDVVDDAGWDPTGNDANFWYYTSGVAGLIDAFRVSGTHTGEIPWLIGQLLASQDPVSGAVCDSYGVHAGDESWQDTAYVMMALRAYDPAYASQIAAMAGWLTATQDVSGGWVYGDGTHLPSVGGEMTTGLAMVPSTVGPVQPAPSSCVSMDNPCLTIPFDITRFDGGQMRAYSVKFTLSPELVLCGAIAQGTYLNSVGTTSYHVVDNGGGAYTVDCAILGLPCGQDAETGTLFTVPVMKAAGNGTGTITVDILRLRDCGNMPLPSVAGPPASITVDDIPPVAISNIASVQTLSGNGTDGTTGIQLTFTAPGDAVQTEVYRAPYGLSDGTSAYPEFDDMVGAGAPAAAAYPPGDPWELTAVTATGQLDEPATRGFWYYVAYTKDLCGNWSPASNVSAGSSNYHLGDVAPIGTGNNLVETADISALGGSYGMFTDAVNYLDVGPTSTNQPNGRPLTDNLIDLEDLMMFAMNYGQVGFQGDTPQLIALGEPASGPTSLGITTPLSLVRAGQTVDVPVVLSGNGVQAVRTVLNYNASVLGYVSTTVSGTFATAPHFFKDLPVSGKVDLSVALLGHGAGVQGRGTVFTVRLRALRDGAPGFNLTGSKVRDIHNREVLARPNTVSGRIDEPVQALSPSLTFRLGEARPNPFNPKTAISYELPQAGGVQITIYDAAGRIVRSLVNGEMPAGSHVAEWDGRDDAGRAAGSGIYFYAMRAGAYQSQRRMTLLK
jgi:hypothetical protein